MLFSRNARLRLSPVVAAVLAVSACVNSVTAKDKSTTDTMLEEGATIFRDSCTDCHGTTGEGVEGFYSDPLIGDLTVSGLARVISETMPEGSPEDCVGEDADAVAAWMHQAFYGEAAQNRNNPPRTSLSRLTAAQLRQSLADLYAQSGGVPSIVNERGLQAQYFDAANFKKDSRKIERVDATINFDFGKEGPGEGITPEEYAIQWRGGLLAKETGDYEIVVRSTCSFTCQLGDYSRTFIDNHVQSGDKTEFRQTVSLTGGRIYPLQIKFAQRKRKTEQPPASVSLSWTPPQSVEQIIHERHLVPESVPPTFALQTWLPPDDRSYGFERGISVNREWDDSVTEAAVEFATIGIEELWPRYQARHKNDPNDDRKHLRGFLTAIAQTAFRGPLDDATRTLYVDSQIDAVEDDAEAIRQVLLAALKSPRFLYPALDGSQSVSQQHANRLTLVLYDSLPGDKWLTNQIRDNKLETPEQIRAAATQMIADYRVQFKTRQLMAEWLNLRQISDISKDDTKFPGFDEALISELRESFYQFVEGVIWSESSNYQNLFTTTPDLSSDNLDRFYEAQRASDHFETTSAGLLTHPYLMSGLAYRDSSSPIHRGVFLIRHIFGRVLRPPNAAFVPLNPDLHPDLTTRERVHLQTSPEGCQTCHRKINGLGFTMENLDAVGRYREEERGQAIDASGVYTTRSGEDVHFDSPKELVQFVITSDDAHRAFVHRAFLHFVKQPPAAWGPETLERLTEEFRRNHFSIRQLLIEIAVTASQPQTS
jgi:mono/diheme cytochrome c family protein